jgi:hypothetical protein
MEVAGDRIRRIVAWTVVVLAVAGVIGLFATAAHNVGNSSTSQAPGPSSAGGAFAGTSASAPAAGMPSSDEGSIGAPLAGRSDVSDVGPKIIKQAAVRLQIKKGSFADRYQQAISVAAAFGGYVASSDTTVGRYRTGVLVIRVPAHRFEAALAQIKGLGTVKGATVSGEDVTAQYVDLQARLRNWRAQEVVLLRLMSKATTIVDSIRVQQHLQDVQGTIEEIEGRLRLIGDQTAMGTMTVSIAEASPVVAPPGKRPALVQAWHEATTGFVDVISAVVVGLGYVIPMALVGLSAWLAWRVLQRTRRRQVSAASAAPAAP